MLQEHTGMAKRTKYSTRNNKGTPLWNLYVKVRSDRLKRMCGHCSINDCIGTKETSIENEVPYTPSVSVQGAHAFRDLSLTTNLTNEMCVMCHKNYTIEFAFERIFQSYSFSVTRFMYY